MTGPTFLDRVLFTAWFIAIGTALYATARIVFTWTYRLVSRHD